MVQFGMPGPDPAWPLSLVVSLVVHALVAWILYRCARWAWSKIAARVRYDRPEDEPGR